MPTYPHAANQQPPKFVARPAQFEVPPTGNDRDEPLDLGRIEVRPE